MDAEPHRKSSSRRGHAILASLLTMAALCWIWLAWPRPDAGMDMTPTMGLSLAPFLMIWIVMMAAMMFPTAAPMILTFHRIRARRAGRGAFLAAWVFVTAYLLMWTLAGVLAFALARGAEAWAARSALPPATFARLGGAVLIAAGVYQFTPLKHLCLAKCRTPVGFIMASWRPGTAGAFRMGWLHGLYCLGCCWLLFAILFPLGMMNVAAMAAVTVLIFVEKTSRWGRWGASLAAILLIASGAAVVARPALLPTYPAPPSMPMDMDTPMDMDMDMGGPTDGPSPP